MKVKIVEVTKDNFDLIPRPANNRFNCKECFYWVEKKDGRTNLTKHKCKWLAKKERAYGGSLVKLLLWGLQEIPVGYIQFGPILEYGTTRLIYENRFPVPKGGWCIACISVQSSYRGQGLATRLIRNVLRDIKRRGVKTVDAYPLKEAHSWNQVPVGPVGLWEKCGFKEVAVIRYNKGEPAPCKGEMLLMRRTW